MELGIWAEQPHIGTTKHFIESGFNEWFIPVNKVQQRLKYPIIEIKGQQFYLAHSAQPKPFMRPAGFERREENVKEVQKEVLNMIESICK